MDEEKQVQVEESRGLTFKDILFIIRKHWIAIIIFVVCGVAAGGIFTKVYSTLRPKYTSTGTMLVSYDSGNTQSIANEYSFSNYITNTYVVFIKEDAVLSKAADKLNGDKKEDIKREMTFTPKYLRDNLSVSATSLILKISFTSPNAEDSKTIVQTIIDTASEVADTPKTDEAGNIIYEKDNKGNDVPAPFYPFLNGNLAPVSPAKTGIKVSHTMRDLVIGFGGGVVFAFAYVVLREVFDNTFKSSEEIERMLGIPVLAGIPDYHFDDEKKGGK